MSEELLPCPFCGGEAEILEAIVEFIYKEIGIYAICKKCRASTQYYKTKEEALTAWNRRADGWIPVSERLPEEYTMVLVWEGDYAFRAEHAEGKWYEATNEPISEHVNITHWMPLPPAPNGGDS